MIRRSLLRMSTDDQSSGDDHEVAGDILRVARAVAGRSRALAASGADVLGSGVDDAVRALVDRRVRRALRSTAPTVTGAELVETLGSDSGSALAPWLGAGVGRLARTGRAARVLGGRTPLGLAVRFGPGIHAAISTNLRGLDAAAAFVVGRARHQGIEPDPDRLRRIVVQALTGHPTDTGAEPDHAALLRTWLQDAARRTVPFGDRVSGLRRRRTPDAVTAALQAVDATALARP